MEEEYVDWETPQLFQVNTVVLEGRHLALKHANTYVILRIGKRKKRIRAKSNKTDSPHFNDFCTFTFHLPLNVLLDQILTIKVYQKTTFSTKILGLCKVELATVWAQPEHQFYHKWAVLADPKNLTNKYKGFLKIDIAILTRGIVIKAPEDFKDGRLDESILVPFGTAPDRHRAKLIVTVYRADSFSSTLPNRSRPLLSQPFIKITYGGVVRKTRTAKNQKNPVWNEELTFLDLFPPLTANISFELCDRARISKRRSIGNTNISIHSIYENGEEGFLPTFGPNFLYLYKNYRKRKRHRNTEIVEKFFTYIGRLLIAIRMEILETPEEAKLHRLSRRIAPRLVPPANECLYFNYIKFIMFACVFNIICFNTHPIRRKIKIRITMGPKSRHSFSQHRSLKRKISKKEQKSIEKKEKERLDKEKQRQLMKKQKKLSKQSLRHGVDMQHSEVITSCNTTKNKSAKLKEDYSFINFSGKYPCVHLVGEWPNMLRRIYRTNVVKKTIQSTTDDVNRIKNELEYDYERRYEISKKLKKILFDFGKGCETILSFFDETLPCDTNLFRERKQYYYQEISDLAYIAKESSRKNALHVFDTINKLTLYLGKLKKLAQDPENSFPDAEIWMYRTGLPKKSHCRIRAEDITYSPVSHERGFMAGNLTSVFFRNKKNQTKAKMDIFMWFGKADDFNECLKLLPKGYNKNFRVCSSNLEMNIPSKLIYHEKHYFEFRAYIFQAKIFLGFDASGLADPYVRLIILGKNLRTKARKKTLSPIWNETLTITSLPFYGCPDFVKDNPAGLVVEVFDKEFFGRSELMGRAFIKPTVRLLTDSYEDIRLKWEDILYKTKKVGQILMVSELKELTTKKYFVGKKRVTPIPDNIRPHFSMHRLEIVFWGVRQMRKISKLRNKVFFLLEFGEHIIKSPVLKNVRSKKNFPHNIKFYDVDLPDEADYSPPLLIKLYHIRTFFFTKSYVATCIVPSMRYFYTSLGCLTEEEKRVEIHYRISEEQEKKMDGEKKIDLVRRETKYEMIKRRRDELVADTINRINYFYADLICRVKQRCGRPIPYFYDNKSQEDESWWSRYQASVDGQQQHPEIMCFKYYTEELEAQPEFRGFMDFLTTFNMVTGHNLKRRVKMQAKLKAYLRLYKVPPGQEQDLTFEKERISKAPTNEPIKILVRVYIVCGKNLSPRDVYGKSDPYLRLQLGKHKISDRKHYVPKQVNPVFGKCFEIKATFPHDNLLSIKVVDYDATSKDDLIGQTSIDIENRYYSKYHASCGLAKEYHTEGVNAWRDIYHPTDILNTVCTKANLDLPSYEKDFVLIGKYEFKTPGNPKMPHRTERQALAVLHAWHKIPTHGFHIVPEHVETRSLYHPKLPGVEQGKLLMWIDIFPADYRFMPAKIDISPQKPESFELRAIVWDVDDVTLDDSSFLFHDKMSDIYVKGWIHTLEEDLQKTDVHYRSINGEGNFNWRFIFRFDYIRAERVIVSKKKLNAFDLHPAITRSPCKLEIQIWDNDAFQDDYLGTLILELGSMPVGAKLSSRANLKMFGPDARRINLFKVRKTRGWWPFRRPIENQFGNDFECTGKVDLELEVLTKCEAAQRPVGIGRSDPEGLPAPKRPTLHSFNWMLHPIKTFRIVVLKKFFRCFICSLIVIGAAFFFAGAMYAFPNYAVKKYMRA